MLHTAYGELASVIPLSASGVPTTPRIIKCGAQKQRLALDWPFSVVQPRAPNFRL